MILLTTPPAGVATEPAADASDSSGVTAVVIAVAGAALLVCAVIGMAFYRRL